MPRLKTDAPEAQSKTDSLLFNAAEREFGERILHHQCWCWGRDIFYPEGNLLIRQGFERVAVPENESGSYAYRLEISADEQIILWGFGVFYGKTDCGMFLPRYGFQPQMVKTARLALPLWTLKQLPRRRLPRTTDEQICALNLTAAFARFVIGYEIWIETTCGRDWRRNCLKNWSNACLSPDRLQRGWRKLLRRCDGDGGKNYQDKTET